jgi:hypothetical protein
MVLALRVALVNELPFPERLWKRICPFHREHQRIVDGTGPGPDKRRQAFERFILECGERMGECPYHAPAWSLIAGAAVAAVESGVADPEGVAAETVARGGGDHDLMEWAYWLVADPIDLGDKGRALLDGQHRVCALKAARALRCPVRELLPVAPGEP